MESFAVCVSILFSLFRTDAIIQQVIREQFAHCTILSTQAGHSYGLRQDNGIIDTTTLILLLVHIRHSQLIGGQRKGLISIVRLMIEFFFISFATSFIAQMF